MRGVGKVNFEIGKPDRFSGIKKPSFVVANKEGKSIFFKDQARALTFFVSFDFWFAAFFQWIIFFLANRSIMEVTSFRRACASSFLEVVNNFLICVRVVLF